MNKELIKIGLVTGAAGGIGSTIAKSLYKSLDILILLDIAEEKLAKVFNEINHSNCKIAIYNCDVGNSESVKTILSLVEKEYGLPNILINNAGIGGPFHRIDEVSDEEWYKIINTNLKGIFNLSKHLLPNMKKLHYGKIVNIASIQGYLGASLSSTYVASKHGVIGYTKSIAAEWGQYSINCNAICPGYVDTTMGIQNNIIHDHYHKVIKKTPLTRIATTQEIANLVKYLISDESSYITGAVITIDGGLTCHIRF